MDVPEAQAPIEYHDAPTREELVEQAETVLSAVKATMYHPVARGEAETLVRMLEEKHKKTDG